MIEFAEGHKRETVLHIAGDDIAHCLTFTIRALGHSLAFVRINRDSVASPKYQWLSRFPKLPAFFVATF